MLCMSYLCPICSCCGQSSIQDVGDPDLPFRPSSGYVLHLCGHCLGGDLPACSRAGVEFGKHSGHRGETLVRACVCMYVCVRVLGDSGMCIRGEILVFVVILVVDSD